MARRAMFAVADDKEKTALPRTAAVRRDDNIAAPFFVLNDDSDKHSPCSRENARESTCVSV